jgi:hypothetical protein
MQAAAHQRDLFAQYYEPIGYSDIDPQQRCWPLGAVRQFTWHDVTIEQFPGYVLFLYSGAEQYRIVYLDKPCPIPAEDVLTPQPRSRILPRNVTAAATSQ